MYNTQSSPVDDTGRQSEGQPKVSDERGPWGFHTGIPGNNNSGLLTVPVPVPVLPVPEPEPVLVP